MKFCSHLFENAARLRWDIKDGALCSSRTGNRLYTTRMYHVAIGLLTKIGAIEMVRSYRVGERPKCFRLAPPYWEGIVAHEIHAPRLEKRFAIYAEERAVKTPLSEWLKEVYNTRCTFSDDAHNLLTTRHYDSDFQRASYQFLYDRFVSKSDLFHVAISGRITYMPNLIPKTLRQEILIDGEPIVEVDIVSSQPRLAASLLPNSAEKEAFIALIDSGDLYETVARWVGERWDRDKAKEEFFRQILYGNRHAHDGYPLWREFSRRFPGLAAAIIELKGDSSRDFPVRVQCLESQIMIDGVAAECAAKHLAFISIHDGVGCKLCDADQVAEIVNRHWVLKTGFAPRVRVAGEFRANALSNLL